MKSDCFTPPAPALPTMRRSLQLRRAESGFGLMEAIMAMGLIMLIALSTTQTFLASNRIAASNRVLTAARTIVQRNLDMAMSQRFDGTSVPANLAITTSPSGASTDDDGGATGRSIFSSRRRRAAPRRRSSKARCGGSSRPSRTRSTPTSAALLSGLPTNSNVAPSPSR